ncbi:MAG: hypothetical protein KA978_24505 [Deltaproteobacteria bacterium]|jgi:hypothetical protein|nr:hypothetical protein [Deltaproteobacteria bacterium]
MTLRSIWHVRLVLGLVMLLCAVTFTLLARGGVVRFESVAPGILALVVSGLAFALPWGIPPASDRPRLRA